MTDSRFAEPLLREDSLSSKLSFEISLECFLLGSHLEDHILLSFYLLSQACLFGPETNEALFPFRVMVLLEIAIFLVIFSKRHCELL